MYDMRALFTKLGSKSFLDKSNLYNIEVTANWIALDPLGSLLKLSSQVMSPFHAD